MKGRVTKLFQKIPLLLTAMLMFSLTTVEAKASNKYNLAEIQSYAKVDSQHSNTSAGNQSIPHGVSQDKTGYLVYMLDNNGNPASSKVWAFQSPNFVFSHSEDSTLEWIVKSRKGNFSIDNFNGGEAPWGVRAWDANGTSVTSNEPTIKEWFEAPGPNGVSNALGFVSNYFGLDVAHKFGQEEAHIVVEIIMHLQFSYGGGNGMSEDEKIEAIVELNRKLSEVNKAAKTVDTFINFLKSNGLKENTAILTTLHKQDQKHGTNYSNQTVNIQAEKFREEINASLSSLRSMGSTEGGREMIKPALVGTVPNLVKFKSGLSPEPTVFDSYLNKAACFASYIHVGDIGEKIGFTAYSDGIRKLSNAEVQSLGVAMMVISCADASQTTYDESQGETPAPPADESDGKFTIIKSYRKKIGETKYEDEGTFHIKEIAPEITIENEKSHKVVEWRISTTENTDISSLTWESSVPPSVSDTGKNPTTVKLKDPEKVLYVLLERTEEEPPEPADYNYLITESQITRRIKISEPDNKLSMPDILNHTFKWVLPAHKTTCSGHTYTAPCDGSHTRSVKTSDGCPDNCTKDQTDPTHQHQGAQYDTQNYNCGQNCKTQTAYCSGWDWKNKDLKLSLHNINQQSSPNILAIKTSPKNWFYNPNTNISKLVQGFYRDNNTFDRAATSQQIYENKNWDYICVIHRGQDKLNLAEWINNGQGQYDPTEATTNLQGVNNEVYQASNQSSGQRKQNGFYTETFQVSIGRQEHGVEQTDNETIYAPTIPSSVPGQSLLSPSAICPDDQIRAQLTPLSFNVIVRVEVYKGLETADKHDGFEDGHTSKPRGNYIVSGRMIKGSNISFIPYILMKYDTIDEAITDAPAYVMGEHTRDMSLLHYGEIAWNKSSNPNLLSYYNYIFIEHCYTERCFFIV